MLVVLAKTPRPGFAKTRLVPALGEAGAAALARALAADCLELARRTGLPWEVWLTGPPDPAWEAGLGAPVRRQPDGDLGTRLSHALADGGVAIGADAPLLDPALVCVLHARPEDLVVARAADGGYTAVRASARAVAAGVFAAIPWSTPRTADAQLARAEALGLTLGEVDGGFDVDVPEDLDTLRRALALLPPSAAPHTRAALLALPEAPHAAPHR